MMDELDFFDNPRNNHYREFTLNRNRAQTARIQKVSLAFKLEELLKDPQCQSVKLPLQLGLTSQKLTVISHSTLSPQQVNEYMISIRQEFKNIDQDILDLKEAISIQS